MKRLRKAVALNLKEIRENEKNWIQAEMADFLEYSEKHYNQIENGKVNLSFDAIEKIAQKLGKEVNDLILHEDMTPNFSSISYNQQGGSGTTINGGMFNYNTG